MRKHENEDPRLAKIHHMVMDPATEWLDEKDTDRCMFVLCCEGEAMGAAMSHDYGVVSASLASLMAANKDIRDMILQAVAISAGINVEDAVGLYEECKDGEKKDESDSPLTTLDPWETYKRANGIDPDKTVQEWLDVRKKGGNND